MPIFAKDNSSHLDVGNAGGRGVWVGNLQLNDVHMFMRMRALYWYTCAFVYACLLLQAHVEADLGVWAKGATHEKTTPHTLVV